MKIKNYIAVVLLQIIIFVSGCAKDPAPSIVTAKITVTTTAVTAIQQTTVSSGGQVSGQSTGTVTDRGVCWSTSSNPTISSPKLSAGNGIGSFSSTITSLIPATTYYIRAYATTATETVYGDQQQFATSSYQLSTITAQAFSSIKQTTAVSGGIISATGGGTISAKGICWSTTQNPTTADSKTIDSTGTTTYNSLMTGLTASTTYYVRAYVTNQAGTAYSASLNFTTAPIALPSIDDVAVSSITNNKVTCVSNVSDDGGTPVTNRGICLAPVPDPTINTAAVFTNGAGTGSIVAFISGLASGTTYYVRSYATNSKGTSYSAQVVFKTL
jgi:hypothetical protein